MYMHKKNIYNACDFKTCLDVKLKFKICSNLIASLKWWNNANPGDGLLSVTYSVISV